MSITGEQFLDLSKLALEKWTEIVCKELADDMREFSKLNIVDQSYKQAYWRRYLNLVFGVYEQVNRTPATDEEKWNLILEVYGHLFPDLPSTAMRPDVKARLDWFKRRLAKEFELEFMRQINTNTISSPIEQIFLLEWKFAGLDKKMEVQLLSHEPISTDVGSYAVDFLVVPNDPTLQKVKIAIELDGHEFHEKTQQQVRKDKIRERAIVQQGVTVLRFSGSEIVRDGRGCVEEVEKFLRKTLRPALIPAMTSP